MKNILKSTFGQSVALLFENRRSKRPYRASWTHGNTTGGPVVIIAVAQCLRQVDVLGYDEQEDELLLPPLADDQAVDIVKKRIMGCLGPVNIVGGGMKL
jgi:hypothetical protein